MYPLRSDYENQILQFLEYLHLDKEIQIMVNALSTQVTGEFDHVFSTVQAAIKKVYESDVKATFVIKVLKDSHDLNYAYNA